MSVRELVSKHLFAPAEAKGEWDNAFDTQKAAKSWVDDRIKRRVNKSYYGYIYVKRGGQCDATGPSCKFHVFINSVDTVILNTTKGLKDIKWAKALLKATDHVPFQTTPVNASGQPKVARRSRIEDSASEDSASDGDSYEIENYKEKLADKKEELKELKKKFMKKLNKELDKQKEELKEKFMKKLNKELDEQKKELKERMRGPYEDLRVKLKKCMDKKSDQSDLALENEQLRQKIRKLLTVFNRLKDKVDISVKRM